MQKYSKNIDPKRSIRFVLNNIEYVLNDLFARM